MSQARSPYGISAVLALSLLLAACGQDSPPELLAKAKQALEAKDSKGAQIHLKNALQGDGRLAEARFLLGKLLLDAGDAQGALVEFDKAGEAGYPAPQLVPLQADALLKQRQSRKLIERFGQTELPEAKAQAGLLVQLGQAHQRLGERDEARALFDRALQRDPASAAAQVELARMLAEQGKVDEALAAMDSLLAQQPKDSGAWRLKGDLLSYRQRDTAGARQAYERAVEADPRSSDAQISLIAFLLGQRDLDAAAKQLAQARTQVGNAAGIAYFGAVIDLEQGRLDAAATQIEQLLKTGANDGRILLLAGQLEFLRERYAQAETHLVRAIGAQGNPVRARLLLAQTYLRLSDPARAAQTLQPLIEQPVNGAAQARVHALAGEAYLQLGETRRADEQFRRATALNPKDSRSRTLLAMGKAVRETGADSQGLAELRELAENFESPAADMALVATLVRKGDFAAALQAIDGIERKLPGKGLPATLRAQVFSAQGKEAEARAALEGALKTDPKYLPAALQLARDELRAKKPAEAVRHVEAVVKADPANTMAQLALVNVRLQAGESPASQVQALQALVKQHPQVSRMRAALIRLQLAQGDLAAAGKTAQDAVSALPTEAELVELMADIQLRQRESTLAAKTLDKLIDLRPASPEPLLRRAEIDAGSGKPREAMVLVRKALALRANHGPALRMQVALEAELGNVASARRLVKELQQLPGLEAYGSAVEGDLESTQQQFDAALQAYRRALSRNAALPEVAAKLHRTLRAAGKTEEAAAFARDWLKDHERDAAFLNYLGDIALNDGQFAPARQHYERALALQPRQPLVLNNLAWLALQQGDTKKAEAWAREALKLAGGEAALHDTLSQVLAAAGQHEAAQTAQRQAISLDSNPVYRVGLARRLLDAGRKEAARDELRAVQQMGARYPGQREVTDLLAKTGA